MRKNSAIMFFAALLCIAHAQEIWNGEMDTDWYFNNQDETEFTINSAKELAGLAMLASSYISFEGKTVTLGQSIALNDTANCTPIGPSNALPFNGTFDGNGHIISGIYINDPMNDRQGLFGYLGAGGEIKNVGVAASYIKGDYYASA